jgi:hypothetical protein
MLTLPSFMRIRRRAIGPSRRPRATLKIVCPKRQPKPKNCPPRIPHELSVMQKVARIAADGWKLFSGFLPSDLYVWQGCSSLPHSLWRIFFRYEQERSSTGSDRPFQPFIVGRGRHIVPKERHIERLASGYSVLEACDDSQGRYWFVVTALEVASLRSRNPAAISLTKKRA